MSAKKKVVAETNDDNRRPGIVSDLTSRRQTKAVDRAEKDAIPLELALLAGRARELSQGPNGDIWHAASRALDAIAKAIVLRRRKRTNKDKGVAATLNGAAESVNIAAGQKQVGSIPRDRSQSGAFARSLSVQFAEAIKGRALDDALDPTVLAQILAALTIAEKATIVFPNLVGKDFEAIVNSHFIVVKRVLDDGRRRALAKRVALVKQQCNGIEDAYTRMRSCGAGDDRCGVCAALEEESFEVAKYMIGACARHAGVKQPSRLFASADRK